MEPRVSLITLGVADLERSLTFYSDGLGFQTANSVSDGVIFFRTSGVTLALWGYDQLAGDANLTASHPRPEFPGLSLAHNVRERAQVDEIIALAEKHGATVTTPPHETFWGGYSGYFTCPDGIPWEIAHGAFPIREDGSLEVP